MVSKQETVQSILDKLKALDEARDEVSRMAIVNVLYRHGLDSIIDASGDPRTFKFKDSKQAFIYHLKTFKYFEAEYEDEFFRLLRLHELI
jgi:hypothetical protein